MIDGQFPYTTQSCGEFDNKCISRNIQDKENDLAQENIKHVQYKLSAKIRK